MILFKTLGDGMTFVDDLEKFLFNSRHLKIRILITSISLARTILIFVTSEKTYHEKTGQNISHFDTFVSTYTHHHFYQWIPRDMHLVTNLLTFGTFLLFNLSLEIASLCLTVDGQVGEVLKYLPRSDDGYNKYARLAFHYASFQSLVTFLALEFFILWNKFDFQLEGGCYLFAIFCAHNAYFPPKNVISYSIIIYYTSSHFVCKLKHLQYSIKNEFTSCQQLNRHLISLVKLVTQIRAANQHLKFIIRVFLSVLLLFLGQMTCSILFMTMSPSFFLFLYFSTFSCLGLFFFIHNLSSVCVAVDKSVHLLENKFFQLSSSMNTSQKFAFSYKLNSCKYLNSFTYLATEKISRDTFRRVVLWIAITAVRITANNLKKIAE